MRISAGVLVGRSATRTTVLPSSRISSTRVAPAAGSVAPRSAKRTRTPDVDEAAIDSRRGAGPGERREVGGLGREDAALAGGGDDRPRERVLR